MKQKYLFVLLFFHFCFAEVIVPSDPVCVTIITKKRVFSAVVRRQGNAIACPSFEKIKLKVSDPDTYRSALCLNLKQNLSVRMFSVTLQTIDKDNKIFLLALTVKIRMQVLDTIWLQFLILHAEIYKIALVLK